MLAHRQLHARDPESGGLLLGRLISGTEDVVIDFVSRPSGADRATRFRFFRARRPAQQRVTDAWHESLGTRVYLGEWHTHPEDDPTPSCIDRRNWRRIVKRAQFEQPFLFFVIVGRRGTAAWQVLRPAGTIDCLVYLES
jgi:integrative and conjugative element protein (TIGR02256 family)